MLAAIVQSVLSIGDDLWVKISRLTHQLLRHGVQKRLDWFHNRFPGTRRGGLGGVDGFHIRRLGFSSQHQWQLKFTRTTSQTRCASAEKYRRVFETHLLAAEKPLLGIRLVAAGESDTMTLAVAENQPRTNTA
jgi:hypothetical protein